MIYYGIDFSKGGAAGKFANQVLHNQIMDNYVKLRQASREAMVAKKLEFYFNKIVRYVKNPKAAWAKDSFILELEKAGIPILQLFNYSNIGASAAGIKFEEDLAKIASVAFGDVKNLMIGKELVYSHQNYTGDMLNNLTVRYIDKYDSDLKQWVRTKHKAEEELEAGGLYRLGGVSGKIDVNIPNSMVTLKYDFSQETLEFLNLLRGLRITAKNYTDMKKITFGHASLFRVVSSVLGDLNHPKDIQLKVYYSAKTSRSSLAEHKYHIRYAYEVLGIGQYYDINGSLQNLGNTNFLFVYDKNSNYIHVRSTKDMVRQAMNKKNQGSHIYLDLTQ